ncbi:IS66 family transposase [soil metagenome]
MPKSNDKESAALREENARQREELAALRAQLTDSIRTTRDLTEQLKLALTGNADLNEQLKDLRNKLDILLSQYKKSKRKQFGSNNEKHTNPRQDAVTIKPKKPPSKPQARNHKKHILSQDLLVEPVHHYVDSARKICPTCLVDTKPVGQQISYQLERITQTLKKLEHLQEVRSCQKCKQYIVTAEKPVPPISGSYAGPRLLAYICVAKLAYGLPLYRQSKILSRENVNIPRSTQCDWMLAAGLLLEQLVERMKLEIKKSKIVKTDDTEIKIQDRTRNGTLRKGKMTPYIGDTEHPFIIFDFSPDLSFARNTAFFEDYNGMIQCDAAGGFDQFFKSRSRIEVGCSAHSRRNFFDYWALVDPQDADCLAVLDIYREFYDIEREITGKSAAERLAARRKRSKPLVKNLRKLLINLQGKFPPSNGLMKAVAYTLKHWIALTRFLKDPDLDVDNNASERAIKDFILSRKNFLFAGSDDGGKAMAILLSLIATCHRLKIDPVGYLADVFSRIHDTKPADLDTLFPDRWSEMQKQKKAT